MLFDFLINSKKMQEIKEELSEWCYMIPNLMLYSSVGFFNWNKNKEKQRRIINNSIEELFEKTLSMTSKTSKYLEDYDKHLEN